MNIKLVKSLSEELVEITEEMQKRADSQSLTDEELLEFIKKFGKNNSLILEQIDLPKHQ